MRKCKRLLSLLLAAALCLALFGTALAAESGDIVVLFVNDAHCAADDKLGYAGLAAYRSKVLKENRHVTLVDGGDALQGGVLGTLSRGSYIVEIMNKVGFDVIVPGNHEFDYGMDRFLELSDMQNGDYVCCNLIDLETGKAVFEDYKMIDYGDVKVAYVGIVTPETFSKSNPAYFQDGKGNFKYGFCEGNNGADLYSAVQSAISNARAQGADYVVAVGHCGTNEQSSPWRSTDIIANVSGLTAFIDGHSHSLIPSRNVTDKDGNTVVLTSAGTRLEAIGKLVIKADGSVFSELITDYAEKDGDVAAFVDGIRAENEALLGTVVASSRVSLNIYNPDGSRAVRNRECGIGNLVADAYRSIGKADIAIVNGGGVREGIPAGDITYGQIIAVNPFGNELCVCEATGQEILDALEMASRNCPSENGGFLQVSGLKYTIDTTVPSSVRLDDKGMFQGVEGARRVRDVMVLNSLTGVYEPIDTAKTYALASHNYMLKSGGDGLNMFADNNFILEDVMLDNQALIAFITETLGGVVPATYGLAQGRIAAVCHFEDVSAYAWYGGGVAEAYSKGIVNGVSDTVFAPDATMTRGMFVTMLYRAEGCPDVTGEVSEVFADCEDGAWYASAVLWASRNNIVRGVTGASFAPMEPLTREQMAAMLYRYAIFKGAPERTVGEPSYADAGSIADWALPGVSYCTEAGIMNGVSYAAFAPLVTASRAMGAVVLSRMAA